MSMVPALVLIGGLVAPVLLSGLNQPVPAAHHETPYEPRYFWAERQDETSLNPGLAAAQIKRVAASRAIPYFVVRQMVEDNTRGQQGVDVAALNLALDTQQSTKGHRAEGMN